MHRNIFLILTILMSLTPAHASRIALVIGNGDYQNAPTLTNPINDAKDLAALLETLGFQVTLKLNASKQGMENALHDFGERLQNGDVGLFYYSGHGLQSNERNYLMPPEAGIDIELKGFDASRVLRQMEQANESGVNIVILDACRDNPFQSKNKGLAKMKSPPGFLLAYATAPDMACYGDKSIYTKHLLKALQEKASMSLPDLLMDVTIQIIIETRGKQVPWRSDSLKTQFCFGQCASPFEVSKLLRTCKQHFQAYRLTIGTNGTALSCYNEVLKKDPNNADALEGLKKIEAKYVAWIERALNRGQEEKVQRYMTGLRKVNPESPKLAAFEERIQAPPVSTPQELIPTPQELIPPPIHQTVVAGKIFRDPLQDGSLGPEMAWITGGTFQMGDLQGEGDPDEKPVSSVTIQDFAMGRYEVTFAEYDKFAEATGRRKPNDEGWGRGNRPVIDISWYDANAYAEWLSTQTGQQYRLPTEAEWEYAARAGTITKYWWGNEIGKNRAVCDECGAQWGWDAEQMTAPVGSFAPNPFGLYDTVGNVWEWTCSEYEDKYSGKEKQCIDKEDAKNINLSLRGGGWGGKPIGVRSAVRFKWRQSDRNIDLGLRLVRQ